MYYLRKINIMPNLQLSFTEPYYANCGFENTRINFYFCIRPLNAQRRVSMQACRKRPNEAIDSGLGMQHTREVGPLVWQFRILAPQTYLFCKYAQKYTYI